MAIVSRLQLNHPGLGTAGGSGLHASIESLYTKIGDNMDSRWFSITDFDQTEVNDLLHNFGTDISNLQYDLYNWNGTEWVLLTDSTSPLRSAFSVIEKVGSESTTLQITNNTGGDNLTFAVAIQFNNTYLSQNDIRDIDITTVAPEDGQSLVWESSTKKFKPGASGDSSFKIQGVSTPNATIKGGYLMLDDGREIATYDGAGTAATDFGTDIVVNLTTVFGSAPANATGYYLYLNLLALGSEVTIDNGRKVYTIAAADTSKFLISTIKPAAINKTQYAVIGFIKSATTGTVWSGTGAAFGTVASKKFNQRKVESDNYLFDFYNANALGTVGTALVGDVDTRDPSNFKSWQSTNTANISLVESTTNPLRSPNNYLFTGSGVAASGTTFVESPAFQLNIADLGKPVMVSFDIADVTADGNFDVIMVRYNSSGAYQDKISIAGNASGATQPSAKLPTGVAKFNGFFIANSTSTDYYALRFRRLAGTDVPRLDSIKISPDQVIQGAAPMTNFSWRSGDQAISTTAGATDNFNLAGAVQIASNDISISGPSSGVYTLTFSRIGKYRLTLNVAHTHANAYTTTFRIQRTYGGTASMTGIGLNSEMSLASGVDANDLNMNDSETGIVDVTAVNQTLTILLQCTYSSVSGITANHLFYAAIAISGDNGTNVTMANRAVEEFASNTGAEGVTAGSTYSNTSYLAYGSAGSAFVSVASTTVNSATSYLVRFQTPIQATDLLMLEVTDPQGSWAPLGQIDSSPVSYQNQADSYYGVGFTRVSGSSTDVYVGFGNKGCRPLTTNGTAFAASGTAWSTLTTRKWRLRKVSGGASVGFPIAPSNFVGVNFAATATNVSDGTLNPGTWEKMAFSTELFDSNSAYDAATNYRFTVPVAGKYQFNSNVNIQRDTGTMTAAYMALYKNGAEIRRASWQGSLAAAGAVALNISSLQNCAVGDYFEIFARGENGTGNISIESSPSVINEFSGFMVSGS